MDSAFDFHEASVTICYPMTDIDILNLKLNRNGFGTRAEIREKVKGVYQSELIRDIKRSGYTKTFGRFTIHLAQEFGFCYGVDRAVELAYETCATFPEKRVYLTTEIIHNPTVNQDLMAMGVKFLSGNYKNATRAEITKDDVVIIPAFGTTVSEIRDIYEQGCTMVDTICGSVINVWKRVEKYAQEGFTSVIHGKYAHEETLATSSRVLEFPDGQYLIVYDIAQAEKVCDYIVHGGNREEFLKMFANAHSQNFDPDLHLQKIGCANQTTMLSSESLHIAKMLETALKTRYGNEDLANRFRSFDTICSATQERQDAIIALKHKKPDLVLVVGGYNSSNTAHLHEIAATFAPSYHIDRAACLQSKTSLEHKLFGAKNPIVSENWLPDGPIAIGVTSGASTPNKVLEEVIEKILEF